MLRSYLKIALRNLLKQKGLTLINILSLAIGLACFSLFLLYAVNEYSFDRFHTNAPRIFRVYNWWTFEERAGREPASTTPLGPAMKEDLPDVEEFVRIKGEGQKFMRAGGELHEMKLAFADPQLFSVFTFPVLSGNALLALQDPRQVVLTREKALQLFGQTDVVGKELEIMLNDRYEPFTVGAVAEDIPVNSTIRFEALGSFAYVLDTETGRASMNDWNMTIGIQVYVQLREGSQLPHEPARLGRFWQKYFAGEAELLQKEGEWDGHGLPPTGYGLQPLKEVHTDTSIDRWGAVDPRKTRMLVGIAAGILLIACMNFITLAIGRSAGRSKEIGIKKAIGGRKGQLVFQFLLESLLLTAFAAIAGLLLARLLLPYFNELTGRSLTFSIKQYPELTWLLALCVLFAGLISGCYPALVLSAFRPVEVLKNRIRLAGSNTFTKSLVTFQFVLSLGLIMATFGMLRQISFMRSADLGFDKENVLMINLSGTDAAQLYPRFRQTVESQAGVMGVAASAIGLGAGEGQMGRAYDFGGNLEGVIEYPVDQDYLGVLGMELLAGRNFDPLITSDTVSSVIVNETLVKRLNLSPQEALGKEIKTRDSDSRIIIGVTRNFNFEALTREVRPQLFLQPANFRPGVLFVRLAPGDPSPALASLERTWKSLVPDLPFRYSFMDDKFDAFYQSEKRWSRIAGWAGGIAIFLACLGLFGLATLSILNRTKEIGIRKVMGASAAALSIVLTRDLLKLVLFAIVIAAPLAWYFMQRWLEHFVYRTELQWWIFALAGLLALLTALLSIGFQSLKAVMTNPVKSLRSE